MQPDPANDRTLYGVLGEPAPPGSVRGETNKSANKETIDNDVEMLVLEELTNAA
jgi:hypothetical protein